jgi:hypothetical protein
MRHVRDHAQLHHSLDDRPARGRQPARQIHPGVQRADGKLALVLGDALGVSGKVVWEEMREGERGDAAPGKLLEPGEPPGQVVRAEPRAQNVGALDGVHDRRLPRRPDLVELGVGAGHLEAGPGPRHLPLHQGHHRQQAFPGVSSQQHPPAAEEVGGEADELALEVLALGDV